MLRGQREARGPGPAAGTICGDGWILGGAGSDDSDTDPGGTRDRSRITCHGSPLTDVK